jgi:hypothetical protein
MRRWSNRCPALHVADDDQAELFRLVDQIEVRLDAFPEYFSKYAD